MSTLTAPNEELLSILRAAAIERGIDIANTDLDIPAKVEVVESNEESTTSSSFKDTSTIEEIEIVEDEIPLPFIFNEVEFKEQELVKIKELEVLVNTNLKIFIECLELSKLNYDIQQISEDDITFVIYYSNVTITNSNLQSHYLGPCFIKVKIEITKRFYICEFRIYRPHITEIEYYFKYTHSHSSGDGRFTYADTCLGSDGLIGRFKKHNAYYLNDVNLYFYFLSFLKGIEVWLKWESLEGAPYKKIAELVSYKEILKEEHIGIVQTTNIFKETFNTLKSYIAEKLIINENCTISLLINFKTLYTALNFLGIDYYTKDYTLDALFSKGILCYTDGTNYYRGEKIALPSSAPESEYTFKGKLIKNKIIFNNNTGDSLSVVVSPEYARHILTHIYYVYYENLLPYIV